MKRSNLSLKLKINLVLGLLLFSILICWGVFYIRASNAIEQSSEHLVTQVSGRVSDLVYTAFLYLEHTAMVLSTSTQVAALLQEDTPLIYYSLRDGAVELADSVYQPNGLVDNILVYDTQGNYCRLRGDLGNTAATRLGYLLPAQDTLQYSIITLDGSTYLTYSTEVRVQGACLGYVVFLMETAQLQEIFESYDSSGLISVSLVAGDALVSNTALDTTVTAIAFHASTYSITSIGSSPFSVLVWDDGALNDRFLQQVILIGLFIGALLLLLMFGSYRLLHQLVFSPVLQLMDDTKAMEEHPERLGLALTGQLEFDQLVLQFNQLIARLDERTKAAFALEHAMQVTELARQTAINTSLKKQINAHFTVNTLAVIRRLNQLGETEKVGKLSDGLAYLLRYAYDAEELISCMDEMQVLEKYLTMMQIRYPNRFVADVELDSAIEDLQIPRMLLQPILENAILHGFSNAFDGVLTLYGTQTATALQFIITDNGRGIAPDALAALTCQIADIAPTTHIPNGIEKIALVNIQKRIVTDFGAGYGLTIVSAPNGGCTVTLSLPL